MARLWIGFAPYALLSIVHVIALAADHDDIAAPTKLGLMPLLAAGVVYAAWGRAWTRPYTLLIGAITASWLGDSAGAFFPNAPTLPLMLLFFAIAHVFYIVLFWRILAVRRVPAWSVVFALWWGILLAVLWPHVGALLIPVALYGVILGSTAVAASRCSTPIVIGGVLFLASDSILAFRLFLADAMPDWTSPAVMLTYTLGQGLLAAGSVVALRSHSRTKAVAA